MPSEELSPKQLKMAIIRTTCWLMVISLAILVILLNLHLNLSLFFQSLFLAFPLFYYFLRIHYLNKYNQFLFVEKFINIFAQETEKFSQLVPRFILKNIRFWRRKHWRSIQGDTLTDLIAKFPASREFIEDRIWMKNLSNFGAYFCFGFAIFSSFHFQSDIRSFIYPLGLLLESFFILDSSKKIKKFIKTENNSRQGEEKIGDYLRKELVNKEEEWRLYSRREIPIIQDDQNQAVKLGDLDVFLLYGQKLAFNISVKSSSRLKSKLHYQDGLLIKTNKIDSQWKKDYRFNNQEINNLLQQREWLKNHTNKWVDAFFSIVVTVSVNDDETENTSFSVKIKANSPTQTVGNLRVLCPEGVYVVEFKDLLQLIQALKSSV